MTTSSKAAKAVKAAPPAVVDEAEAEAEAAADRKKLESSVLGGMVVDSALSCGMVVTTYAGPAFASWRKVSANNVADSLEETIAAVRDGDLSSLEAALVSQVFAMQAMFADLAMRARAQTSREGVNALTALAIKAQGASRATVQAIAELKSPRQVAFIRQQTNVATAGGQQQVINGNTPTLAHAPAREEIPTVKNKLFLEDTHAGTTLDAGATPASERVDRELEPVGIVDRAAKPARKGRRVA